MRSACRAYACTRQKYTTHTHTWYWHTRYFPYIYMHRKRRKPQAKAHSWMWNMMVNASCVRKWYGTFLRRHYEVQNRVALIPETVATLWHILGRRKAHIFLTGSRARDERVAARSVEVEVLRERLKVYFKMFWWFFVPHIHTVHRLSVRGFLESTYTSIYMHGRGNLWTMEVIQNVINYYMCYLLCIYCKFVEKLLYLITK